MRQFLASAFFLALCLILNNGLKAQPPARDGIPLLLPKTLQSSRMEFSSMAWYKNGLWLVPQFPEEFGGEIYCISRSDIRTSLRKGKPITGYKTIAIDNLFKLKQKIGPTYDGIEATVILKDEAFFTIESKETNPDCYLIKGKITDCHITLDPEKIITLPKLKRLENAGFESLAWWPEQKQLLSLFEYNKEPGLAKLIAIDPLNMHLEQAGIPVLPFRITDMVHSKQHGTAGNFLIINHLYDGAKENAEYVGKDSVDTGEPSLSGKNLKKTNYTRIMRFTITGKPGSFNYAWKKERDIDFTTANWEGIALFKKGVLLITDEYPGSILKWFRL